MKSDMQAKMDEIERFVRVNTFWCAPMHARISRQQCGVNIKAGEIPQCGKCPERALADFSTVPVKQYAWKRGKPSINQKEKSVEYKTYTISELAGVLGVNPKVVANSKHSKSAPRPGSKIHQVVEGMKERGITWDMVVAAYGGKPSPAAPVVGFKEQPLGEAAPEPQVIPAQAGIQKNHIDSATLSNALDSPVKPGNDGEEATAAPMPYKEIRLKPQKSNDVIDFYLGHIPLEALAAEIVRRMPRAEIVLRG